MTGATRKNYARAIPAFFVMFLSMCGIGAAGPLTWGFALDGYPVSREKLKAIEVSTGLKPGMVVFFLQWPGPDDDTAGGFPLESLEAITSIDATPCITWEPMHLKDGSEVTINRDEIIGGRYDGYIRRFAEDAKNWKKPLLIRFGHEMNVKRYHWGTPATEFGPQNPALYRQMYRYVADIFRNAGADNVRWVFCPNAENVPDASYDPSSAWNTFSAYYPGSGYVDILGVDGYNWGTTRKKETHGWDSTWMSFGDIFQKPVVELRKLDPGKPVFVFETSTTLAGGDKEKWIIDMMREAPRLGIDGIVWFQSDKEVDWRIESGTGKNYIRAIEGARDPQRH